MRLCLSARQPVQDAALLSGLLFSLRSFAEKLSPLSDQEFHSFRTSAFKCHYYESTSSPHAFSLPRALLTSPCSCPWHQDRSAHGRWRVGPAHSTGTHIQVGVVAVLFCCCLLITVWQEHLRVSRVAQSDVQAGPGLPLHAPQPPGLPSKRS
jgi:hypothetical protein